MFHSVSILMPFALFVFVCLLCVVFAVGWFCVFVPLKELVFI